MKRKVFIIAILFFGIISLNLKAEMESQIPKSKITEVQIDELQNYGINAKRNTIEFFSENYSTMSGKEVKNVRKFVIKSKKINIYNAKKKESAAAVNFPIRLAVLKTSNSVHTYFNSVVYFDRVVRDKFILSDTVSERISNNNWKCLFVKLDNDRELYLWYEPSEMPSEQSKETETSGTEPTAKIDIIQDMNIYPNPTRNGLARINFKCSDQRTVSINIFDVSGNKVLQVINDEKLSSGELKFDINGENLADGMYFVVITTDKGETYNLKLIKTNY